jgi:hypothetical protein
MFVTASVAAAVTAAATAATTRSDTSRTHQSWPVNSCHDQIPKSKASRVFVNNSPCSLSHCCPIMGHVRRDPCSITEQRQSGGSTCSTSRGTCRTAVSSRHLKRFHNSTIITAAPETVAMHKRDISEPPQWAQERSVDSTLPLVAHRFAHESPSPSIQLIHVAMRQGTVGMPTTLTLHRGQQVGQATTPIAGVFKSAPRRADTHLVPCTCLA